ncbi:phosphoketolase family protein [Arthrobacter rhombi]|uniref:phosphoketolase family protein n=1 Tax=Arthrobacter rhombi TaxID=71253 RepID=UPI003FCFF2C4
MDTSPDSPHTESGSILNPAELQSLDLWWRAANYVSVGQIYLRGNPLLRRELTASDVKTRLLGHWGTTPGLNFIHAHLNRSIQVRGQQFVLITGPGHGGPANIANAYLEGTYTEIYPEIPVNEEGLGKLFLQFSYPGGVPSHAAPQTPGSINEGGELGYSLAHAFGAVFDNPGLIAACIIGDGEAETGPLAGSWQSAAFLDPVHDGAVLPILHLNGYKIANPTVLARMPEKRLRKYLEGLGYAPHFVTVSTSCEHENAHQDFAAALDECLTGIAELQNQARSAPHETDQAPPAGAEEASDQAPWPMIVLRSPKGWTGPDIVDGTRIEGTWRAHQVPLSNIHEDPSHLALLEQWLASYRPEELFDDAGAPRAQTTALAPHGGLRMSATAHANGGRLLKGLALPEARSHAVEFTAPGSMRSSAMINLAGWVREVIEANPENFRLFGPDETASNRLGAVYEATDKAWQGQLQDADEHLARAGRVMEVLSEHLCQGWLEGYLLTGRHGIFNCYEAFVHIVDSMFNQHAKWLENHRRLAWRKPVASLNYLLSSHVWEQDHNGFSHQDPGFIDLAVNKQPQVVRVYLPPDANTLLVTMDHVLRSRDYVNVVVVGKTPTLQWLDFEQAQRHCAAGLGIWDFAGNESGNQEPDVILACAGDVPTTEVIAAAALLRRDVPELRIRVVNVVDLMRLQDARSHPHGLAPAQFDAYFTTDRPVVFAYHGYPALIHRLVHRQTNQQNFHVHGFIEEGTTTTGFDMAMLNGIDRYHLALDVLARVPDAEVRNPAVRRHYERQLRALREYTRSHGEDPASLREWTFPANQETP